MALVPTPAIPVSRRGPFGDFRPKVDYGANEREKTMTQVQLVTGSGDEDVKVRASTFVFALGERLIIIITLYKSWRIILALVHPSNPTWFSPIRSFKY
jgi:hypothetical protein